MFNRPIDYLRISVTDRCNLRCIYCMPEDGIESIPHQEILTFEEIIRLVSIFAELGIKKIKLTGGEPLVRKNITDLIKALVNIDGIEEVSLTTNGVLLSDYADEIKKAGVNRLNISLDTLKEERFMNISGRNLFHKVMDGIENAKKGGFSPLKLNVVVMKGINDDEVLDFVNFSLLKGLVIKFIEFMRITPLWKEEYFTPIEEVKSICERNFAMEKIKYQGLGPAEYYKIDGGIVGFIKTDEKNCCQCNRLRLTAAGELKLCLYETDSISLKEPLRSGMADRWIRDIIAKNMNIKEFVRHKDWNNQTAYMSAIGG